MDSVCLGATFNSNGGEAGEVYLEKVPARQP